MNMKEKKGKRLWGRMKGEPNERGQTDDSPNLMRNLLQKPSLLVNTPRARKEREGRRKREGGREGSKGVPSYGASVQGHTKKEGLPALTKAGTPKEEGEERKKRRKERERERKGEERKEGVPSYEQSSRDTPKKGRGDPEYYIQENHRKQKEKGGGKGEKGG